MESANYSIKDYNNILNACIGIFNILNLGKIIYLELVSGNSKSIKLKIKNNLNKSYFFITDEFGKVVQTRADSLDGKIIYTLRDDYNVENNTLYTNKGLYTSEKMPWLEYLEIDEDTGKRKLRGDTPEEIVDNYNKFNSSKPMSDIKNSDYIIISSSGYFSDKKINRCLVSLKENKIYNYTYAPNNNDKYEYIKDLTNNQKEELMKYINDNNLLNISFDILVFDASDVIEINISGKKNVIRNASKEFTNNEMHIFDDIVDIVFNNENNSSEKSINFFNIDLNGNKEIIKFAQEQGYKGAEYIGKWKEYKVYNPYFAENQLSYIGLSLVILVNDNGEIRMSTSDEAMAALNDINNYEENLLKREKIVEIINSFKNERNNYENNNIPVDLYLKYLDKIEIMLNNYSCKEDSRFINNNISNINWISNDDAIDYLFDNIIGNIPILPMDVPQGCDLSDISIGQEQYYKDGYICRQEMEMLLKLINEIRKYIETSNNESERELESK